MVDVRWNHEARPRSLTCKVSPEALLQPFVSRLC